jgi:hypothetical protein
MLGANDLLLATADPKAVVVPLAQRGVQVQWLVDLGRQYGYSQTSTDVFIRDYVIPRTTAERIPLYARVPAQYRGPPSRFISHAWSDRFYGEHGTGLIGILEYKVPLEEFVWVDFACHNQHHIEQVPKDLHQSIAAIGAVDFCIDSPVLLTRSWCVYEFLTSHDVHARVSVHMAGGHRADQHAAIKRAIEAFTSLQDAQSTQASDKQAIDEQVLRRFRKFELADRRVRALLDKTLFDFQNRMNAMQKHERGSRQEKAEARKTLSRLHKRQKREDLIANARRVLWRITGL